MGHDPRISVICSVFNEARHVSTALRSALRPEVAELVVVDDGSTDGTAAALAALAAEHHRVTVLSQPHAGRAAAIALAFRHASAPFVMNIDADDVVHPEWMRVAARLLSQHEDVAALSACPCYITGDETVIWPSVQESQVMQDVTRHLAIFNPMHHSSTLMRRAAVEAVGGYSPARRSHVDYDLWVRLAAAGWRLGVVRAPLVAKRLHANQKFERTGRMRYLAASAVVQARAIRAVEARSTVWLTLAGRLGWGLLPRAVRLGVRRHLPF